MKYYDVAFDNDHAHEPLRIKGNIDVSKIPDNPTALKIVKDFMLTEKVLYNIMFKWMYFSKFCPERTDL